MRTYLNLSAKLWTAAVVLFGTCAIAIPSTALAQSATPAAGGVSCFLAPAKLSDQAIGVFMANPASLLTDHPEGGIALSSLVRALAGSDIRTVDALIELGKTASPQVKAAIAAGLANAASSCVRTRPDIAQTIQEKIATSEDGQLITAFLSVSGTIDTASLAAATGGEGGGPGGIGGSVAGPGGVGPNSVPQGGGLGGFSVGGRGGFSTTTINQTSGASVSPSVQ